MLVATMLWLPLLWLPLGLAAPAPPAGTLDRSVADLRQEAEAAWARRADGFEESGRPAREPVETAIEAWRRVVEAEPADPKSRFALIEALYFIGHFVETDPAASRIRSEEQLALALDTRERLGGESAEAEFWAAISWGVWGMSHSRLAAARRGVANRIREHAERLARLDPGYADAAADRLLGRLHTATPKVPLVTGWLDREEGIALLRRACAFSTRDGRNPLFLAEALLRFEPSERTESLRLLRDVACRSAAPSALVEESETIAQARLLLAEQTGESWSRLAAECPSP